MAPFESASVPPPLLSSQEVRLFARAWALGFLIVMLLIG